MKTIKNKFFAPVLFLLLAFGLPVFVYSQVRDPDPSIVAKTKGFQEFKLKSSLMKREMPYRVILPTTYEANKTEKFPVVYLLHGLTGHYDNWTNQSKLVDYAKNYRYIIVTPEGNDGWYSDSQNIPDDKYESYIIQELIPEIEKKFRAETTRDARAIAGLSMGGYGSLKFGVKYPDKFVLAGSFSGALRAAQMTEEMAAATKWQALIDSIKNAYGVMDSEGRKQNDLFKLVTAKSETDAKNLPFFYIDCGTEDGLVQSNREFVKLLADKKIAHEFRELPGIHDWKFWDSQVQEFLRVSEKFIKSAKAKSM